MKHHLSPFKFNDYREFLRTALKEKGFSYRSFAKKHENIISFITIAQTLSKGRSGTKNKPSRNLSPELLARLGKLLKLSDDEITFLILLKLENDSEVFPGLYGSAYFDSIKSLIKDYKAGASQSVNKSTTNRVRFSKTAETIAEFIDLLPNAARGRLSREILIEAKGILSRQNNKAGVKAMASVMERLEGLLSMGTP